VNISKRLVVFGFFALVILIVGVLFWPLILSEVVMPISLVVWLLLRLFVLSIDQQYYWAAIIFVVVFFIYRLFPSAEPVIQSDDFQDLNVTIRAIGTWRSLFTVIGYEVPDKRALRQELINLLLSLYATKLRTSVDFRLYDALQKGEIPIPKHIHDFLFLEEPRKVKMSFKRLIQSIQSAPRRWIRRWTGQEVAEHYRMVDEVLDYLEESLEMKNDDGKFNPS
jgi:hypothetical protein